MKNLVHLFPLVFYMVRADLRSEARRYYISYFWWIFEPSLRMLVLYLVFGVLLQRGVEDYVPFLFTGVITWQWMASTVLHSANSIVDKRGLINKVYLPKIIFPTVTILTDTFKFLIILAILILYLIYYGFPLNIHHLALIYVLITELLLIISISYFFAAVTPFFVDIRIFLQTVLQLIFFLSGVFFKAQIVPPQYHFWFYLNPMATIIESYRDILMYSTWPNMFNLSLILLFSCIAIILTSKIIQFFDQTYPKVTLA